MKSSALPKKMRVWVIASTLLGTSLVAPAISAQTRPAQTQPAQTPPAAQILMQQQGTLLPMQQEHTFAGKKGQAVTISMSSAEFDTFLSLLDPSGQEIANNDDYARTLNSAIVATLPADGTYKILARSFAGQGGNYTVTVKPATAYEQAYARGITLYMEGKLEEATNAYTEAIRLEPEQPTAYLDRGDVYYAQGNIPALIADYRKAAELYEKAGDPDTAQMLRDQAQSIQDMPAEPSSSSPDAPSATP